MAKKSPTKKYLENKCPLCPKCPPWPKTTGERNGPCWGQGCESVKCIYGLECRLIAIWRREREKRTKV